MTKNEYILTCLAEELGETLTELIMVTSHLPGDTRFFTGNGSLHNKELINLDLTATAIEIADVLGCFVMGRVEAFLDITHTTTAEQTKDLTIQQYLLLLLSAQKAVCKLLRFGIDHIHPVYKVKGTAVVSDYLSQILQHANAFGIIYQLQPLLDYKAIDAKISKVNKYYETTHLKKGEINV